MEFGFCALLRALRGRRRSCVRARRSSSVEAQGSRRPRTTATGPTVGGPDRNRDRGMRWEHGPWYGGDARPRPDRHTVRHTRPGGRTSGACGPRSQHAMHAKIKESARGGAPHAARRRLALRVTRLLGAVAAAQAATKSLRLISSASFSSTWWGSSVWKVEKMGQKTESAERVPKMCSTSGSE